MITPKSLLSALALFASVSIVTSLSATLTPGAGSYIRNTSTELGYVAPGQTIILDLVQVYRADAEITLINDDNGQPLGQFLKTWDYGADTANAVGGWASDSVSLSIQNNDGYDTIVLGGVSEGNYHVNMDVLAPDYSPDTYEATYGQFDHYGDYGYGYMGVEMGSGSQSFAWTDISLLTE